MTNIYALSFAYFADAVVLVVLVVVVLVLVVVIRNEQNLNPVCDVKWAN